MKIGKITDAERVVGSRKLIKLSINIGGSVKQSIAGLGDQYTPEGLEGKLVAVVTNLEIRKIFGLQSEVMLLAAVDGQHVSILHPDKQVSAGSKIT